MSATAIFFSNGPNDRQRFRAAITGNWWTSEMTSAHESHRHKKPSIKMPFKQKLRRFLYHWLPLSAFMTIYPGRWLP